MNFNTILVLLYFHMFHSDVPSQYRNLITMIRLLFYGRITYKIRKLVNDNIETQGVNATFHTTELEGLSN